MRFSTEVGDDKDLSIISEGIVTGLLEPEHLVDLNGEEVDDTITDLLYLELSSPLDCEGADDTATGFLY